MRATYVWGAASLLVLMGHSQGQILTPSIQVSQSFGSGGAHSSAASNVVYPPARTSSRSLLQSSSGGRNYTNGRIAFASNQTDGQYQIFTADADGSNVRQLTFGPGTHAHPSYSPDGQSIAFSSDEAGNFDVWVMSADGSNQRQLTSDPALDMVPCFSPDGQFIVFESDRAGGNFTQIYRMRASDGGDVTRLTNSNATDMGAKYSPDGATIAFASARDRGGAELYDIWLMDADGANPRRLTNGMHNAFSRSWAPDSSRLVFNSQQDALDSPPGVGQLFLINADGSGLVQLTNNTGQTPVFIPGGVFPSIHGEVTPVWSPDGTRIAWCSDRTGNYEVFTMSLDGSDPYRVTQTSSLPAYHISVGWQPVPVSGAWGLAPALAPAVVLAMACLAALF